MAHGPTYIPLNFESDLDHCLDKKKIFLHLLIIVRALAEVCPLQVLLL